MNFILQSTDLEKLEDFSQAIQSINDEANRVCKDLFKVTKLIGTDYEWELTVYGKQIRINADDVLKVLNQNNSTHYQDKNFKEVIKELVAWKIKAL